LLDCKRCLTPRSCAGPRARFEYPPLYWIFVIGGSCIPSKILGPAALAAGAGTGPGFIRISAAPEDAEDVVADLARAPEKA
jgi:hypothetical protein